jgi:hypothetical protein
LVILLVEPLRVTRVMEPWTPMGMPMKAVGLIKLERVDGVAVGVLQIATYVFLPEVLPEPAFQLEVRRSGAVGAANWMSIK